MEAYEAENLPDKVDNLFAESDAVIHAIFQRMLEEAGRGAD